MKSAEDVRKEVDKLAKMLDASNKALANKYSFYGDPGLPVSKKKKSPSSVSPNNYNFTNK